MHVIRRPSFLTGRYCRSHLSSGAVRFQAPVKGFTALHAQVLEPGLRVRDVVQMALDSTAHSNNGETASSLLNLGCLFLMTPIRPSPKRLAHDLVLAPGDVLRLHLNPKRYNTEAMRIYFQDLIVHEVNPTTWLAGI